MAKRIPILLAAMTALTFAPQTAEACTGITLTAKDNAHVVARTIEWGGSELNSQYVIVPRGYSQQSLTPGGSLSGMEFTSRYGYVGLAVEQKEFVAEGLNEAGLSAGLFYFPGYGKYEEYDPTRKASSIADLQLVSWLLGSFSTVDEVKEAIENVTVIAIDPRASTVHWRIADKTGRQLVLEFIDGQPRFYENKLGVLTNSPGFVVGFTDIRSAFFFTSNVPNPCIEIIFPSSNCRVISASNEATSSEVSFNVYPNLRDNSEVNSLLFKM